MSEQPRPRILIEASWEVANKVGGIHTVVSGHARLLDEQYDEYLCVGPLFADKQRYSFEELPAPEPIRQVIESLRKKGVSCVYGAWEVPGRPRTVLLGASEAPFDLDAIKGLLYARYGVDSLGAGYDFDEPLRWAWAVGMFIQEVSQVFGERVVAHLHEWMAGFAGLYVDSQEVNAGTVFTTHATMLGRTISGSTDISLYAELDSLDPGALASELGVVEKYTTEVACARVCDVFTTVSDITALEAKKLLGVAPDIITYNGITEADYPTMEEASVLHASSRERIRDFLNYYFSSSYALDLDQTLIFFTSGRYEYKNKGLDVFTDALGRLNAWMREQGHRKTVIVFYWIPGDAHGIKPRVLEQRSAFNSLKQLVESEQDMAVRRVLRNVHEISDVSIDQLFSDSTRKRLRQASRVLNTGGVPPLCTHNLSFEDSDAIIESFRANDLTNKEEDKVKVIRQPVYLDGHDGLIDLPYEEAIAGAHLGVFPSYYEPWGYTPVEAAGYAVASVTTDLGGFGRFVQEEGVAGKGVFVVGRKQRSYEEVVDELFSVMRSYVDLDKHGRVEQKVAAKQLTSRTTWETFIKFYLQAHNEAYGDV